MKYYYLVFLVLFSFSCNNWDENPADIEIVVEESTPGLIFKANYPKNISVLYFLNKSLWLVGTSDGIFYKSVDGGRNWNKKGSMAIQGKVTCFYYSEDSQKKSYIFAGTEKGVYISDDNGENWKETTETDMVGSRKMSVKGFILVSSQYSGTGDVIVYGWDGSNNTFSSTDMGKSWIKTNQFNKSLPITNITSFIYTRKLEGHITNFSLTYYCLSDSINSYVFCNRADYFILGSNSIVNKIVYSNEYIAYMGSQNGFYRSVGDDMIRNSWNRTALENENVTCLINIATSILFAGTSSGVYVSNNSGLGWTKLHFENENVSVRDLYYFNNYLYVLTEEGTVYYSRVFNYSEAGVFCPILKFPEDLAENVSMDLELKWFSWQNNSENYCVELSTDSSFNNKQTVSYNLILGNTLRVSNLKKNTDYFWRVKAFNLFGVSGWSKVSRFTTSGEN